MHDAPFPKLTRTAPDWGDAKTVREFKGLTRSVLYRLEKEGKIRSTSLRDEGKRQGKKLYCLRSIEAYLSSRATGDHSPDELSARSGPIHAAEVLPAVLGSFYEKVKQKDPALAEDFAASLRESGLEVSA